MIVALTSNLCRIVKGIIILRHAHVNVTGREKKMSRIEIW